MRRRQNKPDPDRRGQRRQDRPGEGLCATHRGWRRAAAVAWRENGALDVGLMQADYGASSSSGCGW
jgi:hypothetical protein